MFDLTPFTYPVSERDKFLTLTRDRPRKSDALSPCDLDADDVDYEMQQGLNLEMITLCGLNQEGFAHFCKVYGRSYRAICLDKCQLIGDLSPLGELENLEYLCIRWNVRAEKLWDMRNNRSLRAVELHDCRKLTQNLALLSTAPGLTDVIVCGSVFSKYPMKSLNAFAAIPNLQYLRLYSVNPACREAPFLSKLTFERFDFEYGLYTTDEIARMVARHPHVTGTYFGAYGPAYFGAVNRVRVSGARKPELRLPEQQKQLERYVREFDLLVEQYRREAAPQEECP